MYDSKNIKSRKNGKYILPLKPILPNSKMYLNNNQENHGKKTNRNVKVSEYDECLKQSQKRYEKGNLKLCPRGYCTAKFKFKVYPSAYANGYASQVCKGTKPDYSGNTQTNQQYQQHIDSIKNKNEVSGLNRWFKEDWRNVCEKDDDGNYIQCGRKFAKLDSKDYPYCRPLNKLPGTNVKTIGELTNLQINNMCNQKRKYQQGIDGKPSRVYLN